MANPSNMNLKDIIVYGNRGSQFPPCATLDVFAGSGIYTLHLDEDRAWTLAHDALDHNGNADTNAIYVSISGIGVLQNTTNNEASIGKIRLTSTRTIAIGPGASTIYFKSAVGGPQFLVIASEKFNGRF